MTPTSARSRRRAGFGAFYIGMSIIGAATLLNIAYDRLSWVGAEMMPRFLTNMYETSGKGGVTTVFVAIGMSIILLGLALPRGTEEQPKPERPRSTAPIVPFYSSADAEDASAPALTPGGKVVLRTQQYVRRKSGPTQ